jgi:hypothetical protein
VFDTPSGEMHEFGFGRRERWFNLLGRFAQKRADTPQLCDVTSCDSENHCGTHDLRALTSAIC